MVRIFRAFVLALVAASSISASPPSTEATTESQQEQTCIAPTVVTTLEAKIQSLEQSNAQRTTKLDTATSTWKNEKSAFEQQLADVETKHREAIAKATELDKKILESEQTRDQVIKRVSTLEKSVQELSDKLKDEKEGSNKLLEQLGFEQKKGRTLADKIKELEREVASARKNNEALRVELGNVDDKLTLSSLLSLYYDEGVILSNQVFDSVKTRTEERWIQLKQTVTELDVAKLSVWKPAEKLYAKYLASTLDPVLANVHRVMEPHVAAYRPLMTEYIQNMKKTISFWYKKAIKRGNRVRGEATRLLQQHPAVAPYASIVVDGSIALVTIPLIIVVVRVVINTLWWILTTIICVLSCGCCCGAKKRSKLKRKMSRKQLSSPTNPINSTSKKTILSPAKATTEKRRTSGKKSK